MNEWGYVDLRYRVFALSSDGGKATPTLGQFHQVVSKIADIFMFDESEAELDDAISVDLVGRSVISLHTGRIDGVKQHLHAMSEAHPELFFQLTISGDNGEEPVRFYCRDGEIEEVRGVTVFAPASKTGRSHFKGEVGVTGDLAFDLFATAEGHRWVGNVYTLYEIAVSVETFSDMEWDEETHAPMLERWYDDVGDRITNEIAELVSERLPDIETLVTEYGAETAEAA